jgi:hypothetical protein
MRVGWVERRTDRAARATTVCPTEDGSARPAASKEDSRHREAGRTTKGHQAARISALRSAGPSRRPPTSVAPRHWSNGSHMSWNPSIAATRALTPRCKRDDRCGPVTIPYKLLYRNGNDQCASGTMAPFGRPFSSSAGRSATFQSPPSALTNRTLASMRRRRMSTSLLWFVSANSCAVITCR